LNNKYITQGRYIYLLLKYTTNNLKGAMALWSKCLPPNPRIMGSSSSGVMTMFPYNINIVTQGNGFQLAYNFLHNPAEKTIVFNGK
jgi:hypothetical protein